jgi:beta-lactamase class A
MTQSYPEFLALQKPLGPRGRLGIAARLLDAGGGQALRELTFNEDQLFPMASTVKIPIAMFAARRINRGDFQADEKIAIDSSLLSPGLVRSHLDHLFFVPFNINRTETVDRLLGFMIHRSDNTATDVLLRRLGGVPAVVSFLNELGIREMHFKRTAGELVAYYYGFRLPEGSGRRIGPILTAIPRLFHPFTSREANEAALIDSSEDCCTPRAMADLLAILVKEPQYALAFSHMERCAGGLGRIRKGLTGHAARIRTFGHKTGSLGGIANDAGFIEFEDGRVLILCIMTCQCSAPMKVRDEQIAAATGMILASVLKVSAPW